MPLFDAVDVVAQPVTRPEVDGLAWPGEAREASGSQWNALHSQPGAASALDQDERNSSRKRSAEAMMIQSAAPQHAASLGTAKTPKSPIEVTFYTKCTRALTYKIFFGPDEHGSKCAHVGCVATRAAL